MGYVAALHWCVNAASVSVSSQGECVRIGCRTRARHSLPTPLPPPPSPLLSLERAELHDGQKPEAEGWHSLCDEVQGHHVAGESRKGERRRGGPTVLCVCVCVCVCVRACTGVGLFRVFSFPFLFLLVSFPAGSCSLYSPPRMYAPWFQVHTSIDDSTPPSPLTEERHPDRYDTIPWGEFSRLFAR